MAKKKKINYYRNRNWDDFLVQATIDDVMIENKEFPLKDGTSGSRFKNVFACSPIPSNNDSRFKTCISWERLLIKKGDLVAFRGYFIKDGFMVKGLSILRKANEAG